MKEKFSKKNEKYQRSDQRLSRFWPLSVLPVAATESLRQNHVGITAIAGAALSREKSSVVVAHMTVGLETGSAQGHA